MADVRVDGEWLHSRGNVSDVSWSSRWGSGPCGPDLAGCVFAVDPDHDTSAMRVGASFEVYDSGVKVFGGVVDQVSRDFPRKVDARGWARRAEDFEAISGGAPTSNPQDAVTGAIARGLQWSNATAFPSTTIGSSGDSVRRLDSLLTEWADATVNRWGVDAYGRAFTSAEPTTVAYMLDASGVDMGATSVGLYTRVQARYVAPGAGDGNPATYGPATAADTAAAALYGSRENSLDLTNLGLISSGTASTYAAAHLGLGLRPRWLQRLAVSQGRLLSPAGTPAHLPTVKAGQVVRLFNLPTNVGGLRYAASIDVVLGEVSYDTNQPTQITLAPTNLAIRSLRDALAAAR